MNLKFAPMYMEEAGGDGDGGGGGGGAETVAADQGWNHGFTPEQSTYAESKGYKSGAEILHAAQQGEQHISKMNGGKSMDAFIERPNMDQPDSVKSFYKEMGVPDLATGYDESIAIGENKMTPNSDKWFRDTAHKHNLSNDQAKGMWGDYAEFSNGEMASIEAANTERDNLGRQNLEKQWGGDYQMMVDRAGAAARNMGFDTAQIELMQKVGGYEAVMQAFDKAAQVMADPAGLDNGLGKGEFEKSETFYKQQIEDLKTDTDFGNKVRDPNTPGHKEAKQRWENLHKLAYPGQHAA